MVVQQLLVRFAVQRGQRLFVLLFSITAHVVVVHEVGGSHDVERGRGSIVHADAPVFHFHIAIGLNQHLAVGLQPGLDAFLFNTFDCGREHVYLSITTSCDGGSHL